MSGRVATISGDEVLLPRLLEDPRWTAYALCDLDPPYRDNARFIGFLDESGLQSVVLLYALPGSHALLAYGDPNYTAAILDNTSDLPESVFLLVQEAYLPAVAGRFDIGPTWGMFRMVLAASDLQAPRPASIPLQSLSEKDIPAIKKLYFHEQGSTFFDPLMVLNGAYVGAYHDSDLIAVSGTHVLSPHRGIAAIGGVYTHPEFRGRGLATATTGAVCETVRDLGVDLIVLNVKQNNVPAIAAYRRLGFETYLPYLEGNARLR